MRVSLSSIMAGKAAVTGLLFLFIFVTGFWLSQVGRPYNTVLSTIHKLSALGALIFLALAVYQMNQAARVSPIELASIVTSGVLFLGTIVSGGLLSTDLRLPAAVLTVHQAAPFLTLLSTTATMYQLLNRT